MTRDDDFEPKLGKISNRGGNVRSRYLRQVGRTVTQAGGRKRGSSFQGNRIGRGAGVGRVLASRDRFAAFRTRRVVVKARLIKLAGRGLKGAQAHLRYLQRDGVTREGLPGDLYDGKLDQADGRAFLERCDGDRHQFRFIVSAEDAIEYDDLKDFTRRLMRQMEEDLGTRLDWVAVDHYNTGHPHTHIVVRGKDDRAKDLIIAREYLSQGMRERAPRGYGRGDRLLVRAARARAATGASSATATAGSRGSSRPPTRTPDELALGEVNSGIYVFEPRASGRRSSGSSRTTPRASST